MVRESRRLRSDVRTKTFVTRYSDTSSSSQNRHPGSSAQSNNRQAVRTGSTPNNSISTNSNAHPSTSPATSSRANPRIVTKRTRSKSCNGRDRSRPQSRNPSRRSSPEPKRGRGRPRNRSDRMGSDDEDGSPVSHRTRSAANSRNVSPDPLSRSSIRTPKRVSTRIRSPSASSRSRSRSSGRRMNSGPSSRRASPSRIRRRRPSGSDNEYGAPVSHRTRSRQASAANSRNASPERPSRSTIRTPRPVDGSSVSTRTRSSSAVSRTRSRSSGRRMDSGRSSRRSSPSPVRRQRPSTSDGDFFKSIEEIFGELSPDEKKEFRKENRSEIDEYLKERSEKDVQIDWGFPPNIEKRLGNVSSMESIQSEEKFLLDAGVDVEKVKRWKANKMYEVESALKLKMKSAERFGKLNKERKLFSDLSDSGKALKMLILRERAPMKSEVQLLVRRLRVSLVPIQNEIEKQRDLESALRVELFNENVPQEKQKKMFADSQCPNFSDFQRKCSSDGVFIQSLKWAWKTVIVPTKKFKEAHAHLLTLEKVYQEKLGPGQAWEEKDFKRMEQITQIKVETLKSWLQQRRKQDEEHIIDPL